MMPDSMISLMRALKCSSAIYETLDTSSSIRAPYTSEKTGNRIAISDPGLLYIVQKMVIVQTRRMASLYQDLAM